MKNRQRLARLAVLQHGQAALDSNQPFADVELVLHPRQAVVQFVERLDHAILERAQLAAQFGRLATQSGQVIAMLAEDVDMFAKYLTLLVHLATQSSQALTVLTQDLAMFAEYLALLVRLGTQSSDLARKLGQALTLAA